MTLGKDIVSVGFDLAQTFIFKIALLYAAIAILLGVVLL